MNLNCNSQAAISLKSTYGLLEFEHLIDPRVHKTPGYLQLSITSSLDDDRNSNSNNKKVCLFRLTAYEEDKIFLFAIPNATEPERSVLCFCSCNVIDGKFVAIQPPEFEYLELKDVSSSFCHDLTSDTTVPIKDMIQLLQKACESHAEDFEKKDPELTRPSVVLTRNKGAKHSSRISAEEKDKSWKFHEEIQNLPSKRDSKKPEHHSVDLTSSIVVDTVASPKKNKRGRKAKGAGNSTNETTAKNSTTKTRGGRGTRKQPQEDITVHSPPPLVTPVLPFRQCRNVAEMEQDCLPPLSYLGGHATSSDMRSDPYYPKQFEAAAGYGIVNNDCYAEQLKVLQKRVADLEGKAGMQQKAVLEKLDAIMKNVSNVSFHAAAGHDHSKTSRKARSKKDSKDESMEESSPNNSSSSSSESSDSSSSENGKKKKKLKKKKKSKNSNKHVKKATNDHHQGGGGGGGVQQPPVYVMLNGNNKQTCDGRIGSLIYTDVGAQQLLPSTIGNMLNFRQQQPTNNNAFVPTIFFNT